MFVGRAGAVLTGDDIYNDDGVGQQRSMIVAERLRITVRIQNESPRRGKYRLTAALSETTDDFRVRPGTVAVTLGAGLSFDHRIVVTADDDAPLGADQELVITATSKSDPTLVDTVRVTVTNVSTPE